MNPTYQSGFYAPGRGTAKYPELWDGCVGAWNPGLGNTGLSLRDWSGNSNNGVLTNGPTWGVSGGRQALTFNGSNYVSAASRVTSGAPSQITASAWIKTTSTSNFETICGEFLTTGNQRSWVFTTSTGGTYLRFVISPDGGSGDFRIWEANKTIINDSKWHFVSVVFQGGVSVSLSVDGIPQTFSATSAVSVTAFDTTEPFAVGAVNTTGTAGGFLTAAVNNVRVYNRALSSQEIRLLAQRPGIAYERAPRKFYSLPAAASSRQYRLFRPSILRGA